MNPRTLLLSSLVFTLAACSNSSSSSNQRASFTASTQNAFTEFEASSGGVQLLEIPRQAPLGNTGFALESGGQVTRLDLGGNPITRVGDRFAFADLSTPNLSVNKLNLQSASIGLITTSDASFNADNGKRAAIFIFNPLTSMSAAGFLKVDLEASAPLLDVNPGGRNDSSGMAVAANYDAKNPIGAVIVEDGMGGQKLCVGFSNAFNFPVANPGTILIYDISFDIEAQSLTIARSATVFTTQFNPKDMTLIETSAGPLLAVTLDGASDGANQLVGGIDFINPLTGVVVVNVPLDTFQPDHRLSLNPAGTRGYVGNIFGGTGSQVVRVYEIDVTNLAASVANGSTSSEAARSLQQLTAPTSIAFFDQTSRPVVSASGQFVYVSAAIDKKLHSFDVTSGMLVSSQDLIGTRTTGGTFEDNYYYIVSRPGDLASTLFCVVSNLDMASQLTANVNSAIDVLIPTNR